MPSYAGLDASALNALLVKLKEDYAAMRAKGLGLIMTRGVPDKEQLALSNPLFTIIKDGDDAIAENGADCRNYAPLDGIPEAKRLFGQLLDMDPSLVFVGGNASLSLMHDCLTFAYIHGLPGSGPWGRRRVKFLCPVPGYDRHFNMTGHFGFELIPVPMTPAGPDMDIVEELVKDPEVKGIWCVPKYSNPQGITYSGDTVRRFASLSPAAADFRVFWDNAYAVHHLNPSSPDTLLNLYDELVKTGREDMAFFFTSTSKITFAGAGISAAAMSAANYKWLAGHKSLQTIGYDKLNMLRHAKMFPDMDSIRRHMEKHAAILRPKFQTVLNALAPLGDEGIASWDVPRGGYFISLNVLPGCAKRVVALCKDAGVTLTDAGATFPYGIDPQDRNIRIAPTFPPQAELEQAVNLLCLCVRLAGAEKLLRKDADNTDPH